MSDETPVQATEPSESQARIDAFMSEYGELVAKHKVDFIQYPVWVPAGAGNKWEMVLQIKPIDTTTLPVKSPFVAQS